MKNLPDERPPLEHPKRGVYLDGMWQEDKDPPQKLIWRLRSYVENLEFRPNNIKITKQGPALGGIIEWVIAAYKCAVFSDKIAFIENERESIDRVVKFKLMDLKEDEEDMWGYEESYRQQLEDLNNAEKRLDKCKKRIHKLEHIVSKIDLMREEAAIQSMLEEDDSVHVLGTCNVIFHQHIIENVEPEGLWNPDADVNQDSDDDTEEEDLVIKDVKTKKEEAEGGEQKKPDNQEGKDSSKGENIDSVDAHAVGVPAEGEAAGGGSDRGGDGGGGGSRGRGRGQEGTMVPKKLEKLKPKLPKNSKMLLKRGDKIELYSPTTRQVFPFTVSKVGEGEITVEQTVYMVTEKLVHIRMQVAEREPTHAEERSKDAHGSDGDTPGGEFDNTRGKMDNTNPLVLQDDEEILPVEVGEVEKEEAVLEEVE